MKLDEFIENCSQGGELDSEGSFSVDSVGALRKTLASALPEPHYYLFQLLQALNQIEAREVKVAVGRRENRISFLDAENRLADLDKLSGYFRKGLSVASSDPLEQIMTGLVTSLGCHVSSAELHTGNKKLSVTVKGLSVEEVSRTAERSSLVLRRALEKGLSYSWSRIWGARKEEFRIRKAFEHTPRPFSIAGLATSPRANWRRSIEGEGRFCLVEAVVLAPEAVNHIGEEHKSLTKTDSPLHITEVDGKSASDDTELAVVPTFLMLALNRSGEPDADNLTENDWQQRRWTLALTNSGNEMAEVQFVRNGFNIAQRKLDLGLPGLHVVGPADDLAVDATGYGLVENDNYEERVNEAKQMVNHLKEALKKLPVHEALKQMGKNPQGVLTSFPWINSDA